MTIWKINPTSKSAQAPADDLSDLMSALDALPTEKRSATKTKPVATPVPAEPVFVQQWFPHGLVQHMHVQECACGCEYKSVTGLFLQDRHRNGATRQVRHVGGLIPRDYAELLITQHWTDEQLEACPDCCAYSFEAPLDDTPADLVRELTKDDRDSLKETAA